MNNFNKDSLLVVEIRDLIVTDCRKQLNNVQNCGLLVDIEEGGVSATGFANTNDKKESWLVENLIIFDKLEELWRKTNKKWDSTFFCMDLESENFNVEFLTAKTMTWRKFIFDHVGEWKHYEKMLERLAKVNI